MSHNERREKRMGWRLKNKKNGEGRVIQLMMESGSLSLKEKGAGIINI